MSCWSVSPQARDPHSAGLAERDGGGEPAVPFIGPVGEADRLLEAGMRLADLAGRAVGPPEFEQHVAADPVRVRLGRRDRGKRLGQVPDRVLPCALLNGMLGRLPGVADGLAGIAERPGGQVVVRDLRELVSRGRPAGQLLEGGGDPRVQPRPFQVAGAGAQRLLDERVPEAEPPAGAARGHQAGRDRGFQVAQELFGVQAGDVFEQFGHDVAACHCGDREQRLSVLGQPVHPAGEHVADTARHVEREHVIGSERAVPVLAADEPDEFCGVERVAAGPFDDRGDRVRLRRLPGKVLEQCRDVGGGEAADREPFGARVPEHFAE